MPQGPVPSKVLRHSKRVLAKFDVNGDGLLNASEWAAMQGDAAAIDYDADGLITLDELAAYTADYGRHRRMRLTGSMVEAAAELPSLLVPTAEWDARAAEQQAALAARQGVELPVALPDQSEEPPLEAEATEPQPAQPPAQQASKRFVTPKTRLQGLPDWFLAKDANGDGQLSVAEYAPDAEQRRLDDFDRFDTNGDGFLTARECPE